MSKGVNIGHIKTGNIVKEKWKKITDEYDKDPNLCSECKISLIFTKRKNKYCSKSCANTSNNRGVRRHGLEPKWCLNCNNKLKESRAKFCSQECSSKYSHKKYIQKVEDEKDFGSITSYKFAKKYLIEKRGHQCEICKNTTWMGNPIPLVFDHIDGRSSNNKLSNVRLVCGNCDMQLPTYKSKNKNSDRKERYLKQKKHAPVP